MTEIWKPIKDFENYEVSNLGNVRALNYHRGKTKELKQKTGTHGYKEVSLHKDNKYYYFRVHRLVAEAFIENPMHFDVIHHINEVKDDNRVENLMWCTISYNTKESSYKRTGENNGMNKPGAREKHKAAVNTDEHKKS